MGKRNLMSIKKNHSNKKKKQPFITLLWWSLLIHIILLVLLLIFAFRKKIIITLKPFKKDVSALKRDLPASLKPRKSAFGATVLFDEKAEFKPPKAKLMAEHKQPGITPDQKPEKLHKPTEKKEYPEKEPQKTPPPKKESLVEKKPEPKTIKKSKKIKKIKKEESKVIQEKKDEEIKKQIEEIRKKQEMLAKAQQEQPAPQTVKIKATGRAQKDKSPIKTPRKSIIAMTKGFVENLKDKGNDWLERKGDDNKRPSFEELKYLSYEQKVQWNLQNSWKQNFAYRPYQKILKGKAIVEFVILQNGDVTDVNVLNSSGNPEIDQIIINSIKLAAPFPPLPQHFGTNNYKTGRIFHVTSRKLSF